MRTCGCNMLRRNAEVLVAYLFAFVTVELLSPSAKLGTYVGNLYSSTTYLIFLFLKS